MQRVWIFADWKLPSDDDLRVIEEVGFSDVVLGVVTEDHARFRPKYAAERVVKSAAVLHEMGCRVHVMAWVRRNKRFIEECCPWLRGVVEETGAASAMLDAEKHWHRGTISPTEAAKLVKTAFAGRSFELGVTGLSGLHKTVAPLLKVCDYGLGQAYSIWKPKVSKHWSHHRATEPFDQQINSWASWSAGGKPLVMGLSNYWATRPSRSGRPPMDQMESLTLALEGSRRVGANDVAYWSLKHMRGNYRSHRERRAIIAAIPRETPVTAAESRPNNDASAVQWLLVQLGHNLGKYGPDKDGVDGSWGNKSQKALDAFRKKQGLLLDGIYTSEDVTAMVNAYRLSI